MALPILAHWAGRSIFDIEPAALARRAEAGEKLGITLIVGGNWPGGASASCWPIWTIPWRPMGNRSPHRR